MITDVLTMMWKESKGLIRFRGSLTKTMLSLLIPVVMMGIYLPLQIGRALVEGPWSLLASVFIPVSVGENKEQKFSHRHGASAGGAVKLSSLQLLKIGLPFPWPAPHGRDEMERTVFHVNTLKVSKFVQLAGHKAGLPRR